MHAIMHLKIINNSFKEQIKQNIDIYIHLQLHEPLNIHELLGC